MATRTLKDSSKDPLAKKSFIRGNDKPKLKAVKSTVETRMLNTRVSKDVVKEVKLFCVNNETTVQTFIREAIIEKLKREN